MMLSSIIILLICFLSSLIITLIIIPKWIYRAKKAKLMGVDVHKNRIKQIPEMGGFPVICGFFSGILIYIFFTV